MTGGQMAPTTLEGMVTSTTPNGRDVALNGYPMKITELIAQLPGTSFVTRQSAQDAASVRKCKRAMKKGIQNVMEKKGTSFIEVVSTCNFRMENDPCSCQSLDGRKYVPVLSFGRFKRYF